jgi:hypothetical protein
MPSSTGDIAFQWVLTCFLAAFAFEAYGNHIFGVELSNNLSAYFVYSAFFFQVFLLQFRLPALLLWIYAYVFVQTFVINFSEASVGVSLIHFMGVALFSLTAFSFVACHRDRILQIVRAYYFLCVLVACFAILQSAAFSLFDVSIYFQNFIGGPAVTVMEFEHQMFGVLPRVIGFSSEPQHFAVFLFPAVYLAVRVLFGRAQGLGLHSKVAAATLILGTILSFSLIGLLSLALAVLYVAGTGHKKVLPIVVAGVFLIGGYFATADLPIWTKLTGLIDMSQSPDDYNFTNSDLSGFALLSNTLVAKEALQHSHYLGTGLNTHQFSYNAYMPSLFTNSQILLELNSVDAGSLFIRLASEFGVPGLAAFCWFIFHFKIRPKEGAPHISAINEMCALYLVVYATRTGAYLSAPLWFFAAIYYYSYAWEQEGEASSVPATAG